MIVYGGRGANPSVVVVIIEETFIGCYNES
jgi:hypothetical protein